MGVPLLSMPPPNGTGLDKAVTVCLALSQLFAADRRGCRRQRRHRTQLDQCFVVTHGYAYPTGEGQIRYNPGE
jgi:hypothetical protein